MKLIQLTFLMLKENILLYLTRNIANSRIFSNPWIEIIRQMRAANIFCIQWNFHFGRLFRNFFFWDTDRSVSLENFFKIQKFTSVGCHRKDKPFEIFSPEDFSPGFFSLSGVESEPGNSTALQIGKSTASKILGLKLNNVKNSAELLQKQSGFSNFLKNCN